MDEFVDGDYEVTILFFVCLIFICGVVPHMIFFKQNHSAIIAFEIKSKDNKVFYFLRYYENYSTVSSLELEKFWLLLNTDKHLSSKISYNE